MKDTLDFEKPIWELEKKMGRLTTEATTDPKQIHPKQAESLRKLRKKRDHLQADIFSKLTAWQKTQIARHPQRPGAQDYIAALFTDFVEMHGDRLFGDDQSIIAGLARCEGRSVVVIGQEKGKTLKERVARNFGMSHPEGYRKALRLMQMAERFDKPIITLVDTPGAYPGAGAEERGQSGAIAANLCAMSRINVPILSVVIGEGGSGGALALSVADALLMLEYSIYSVISPEGCAAILWSDETKAQDAAEALKLTAPDLLRLGMIDAVIPEPPGGAHRAPDQAFPAVKQALLQQMALLDTLSPEDRLTRRYQRLRKIGRYV